MSVFKQIKLLRKSHDGGVDSGVTGYWLIEWKSMFSIVLLRFSKGTREAYHSHAFNAYTWWLKGEVEEQFVDGKDSLRWGPSIKPKYTPKNCFHKVIAKETSWALCFRGKWEETWFENKNGETYELKKGRIRVE